MTLAGIGVFTFGVDCSLHREHALTVDEVRIASEGRGVHERGDIPDDSPYLSRRRAAPQALPHRPRGSDETQPKTAALTSRRSDSDIERLDFGITLSA